VSSKFSARPAPALSRFSDSPATATAVLGSLVLLLAASLLLLAAVAPVRAATPALECAIDLGDDPLVWERSAAGPLPRLADLPLLGEPGRPRLPYRDVEILLPPGTELGAVTISAEGVDEALPGALAVAAEPRSSEGVPLTWRLAPEDGTTFPSAWGAAMGSYTRHGFTVATVRLYPLRLVRDDAGEAWSGARSARSFRIVCETVPARFPALRRERAVPGEDAALRGELEARLLNPEALDGYAADVGARAVREDGFAPTAEPSLEGSSVDYVILTNGEMEAAFQRLADYKTARGISCVVRTVDWVLENYPAGADLQSTLRDFVKDAYSRWATRYVLLGGDVEIIPTRFVHNSLHPTGEGTDLPVDLYYSCLDGTWNADGDEILGEPYRNVLDPGDDVDLVAEVYLGRAPVKTAAEADDYIDKVIAYERDGVGDHYRRILFMSEVIFPSSFQAGMEIQDDGASYSEDIIDSVLAGSHMEPVRLYENDTAWPGSYHESRAAAVDSLQSGRFGIVNHIGHGFFYNMSVGSQSLELTDAAALRNEPNFFLLWGMNCASAAFDYNSIQERFLTNPRGGAVLTTGSARASFPEVATLYQRSFYEVLLNDPAYHAGEVISLSRVPFDGLTATNTMERWTHMNYALLGDPSLLLWSDVPRELTVAAPDSLPQGPSQVVVTVTDDSGPVADAVVCLRKAGEDYAVARTDAAGLVSLMFSPKSGGVVQLNVNGRNLRPETIEIPVAAPVGPYLRLAGMTLVDDGSQGTVGNGNGMAEAGERVGLLAEFENTGGEATKHGRVTFFDAEPLTVILTAEASLEALAAGAAGTAEIVLLDLDAQLADRTRVGFDIIMDGGAGDFYHDTDAIDVLRPELEVSVMAWTDYLSGDGDGVVETGEDVRVTFALRNRGWGSADGLTAWIEPLGSGFASASGTGLWPTIPKLGEAEQENEMILTGGATPATARGRLHVQDMLGHEWTHDFDMLAPDQVAISSLVAPVGGEALLMWTGNSEQDLYGYHIYRSNLANGPFARVTVDPVVGGTYFRDFDLQPMTKYYYRVSAIDSSRQLGRLSFPLSVSTTPKEMVGFPLPFAAESSGHVAVGDVNGDGVDDVVLGADNLYVWDADGLELRDGDGDPETLGPFTAFAYDWGMAGIALANLTNKPGLEIIASCRTTRSVYVFEGDGSIAAGWPRQMNDWNWAAPAAGDLDGDGDLEIVVNNVGGRTYAWHHDGTEFRDGDADPATEGVFMIRSNEWYSFCSPALVDIDHDGQLEIITTTTYKDDAVDQVFALKNDGSNVPGWPVTFEDRLSDCLSSPAVGDLDGDGGLEIVILAENDKLHVLQEDGSERAPFPIPFTSNNFSSGAPAPSPAFGDFDADGVMEIVAVSVTNAETAAIHVLSLATGENIGYWPQSIAGTSECSPLVGDMNGDGTPDVLFGVGGATDTAPNLLYAYRGIGAMMPGFPMELSGPVRSSPTLTDFDRDGDIDIVYGGWDLSMHVWDLPGAYVPALVPWPTFGGNPLRTGLLDQEWITAVGDGTPPARRLVLRPNRPNPFNPSTRISFAIPAGYRGPVRLGVFDLRGREVATLIDRELAAGEYTVDWRGLDDSGRKVASGVYLYRLKTDGDQALGKMMLVR